MMLKLLAMDSDSKVVLANVFQIDQNELFGKTFLSAALTKTLRQLLQSRRFKAPVKNRQIKQKRQNPRQIFSEI